MKLFAFCTALAIAISVFAGAGLTYVFAEDYPPYNPAGNLFSNGDCSNTASGNGWTYYGAAGHAAISMQNEALKITVYQFHSTNRTVITVTHNDVPLQPNKVYKVSFWMKCSETVKFGKTDKFPGNNQELLVRVMKDTNTYVDKDGKQSYLQFTLPAEDAVFEKDTWKKVEGILNTEGFEAAMDQEKYLVRFFLGTGTVITDNTAVKELSSILTIILDSFELREVGEELPQAALELTAEGAGEDDVVLTADRNVENGAKTTITAAVKPGKNIVFEKWVNSRGEIVSSDPVYTFENSGDTSFKAVFKNLHQYDIEVEVNDSQLGTVSQTTGKYNYGDTVTLTAVPNGNNKFECWEEDGYVVSTNTDYKFTVKGNHKIKANFVETGKHKVVFKDAKGKIFKIESVEKGKAATAPSAAELLKPGYEFAGWDKDFSNITEDTEVTAIYKQVDKKYTVSVENGAIDGFGGTNSRQYEFDSLVTVIANDSKNFSYWKDGKTNRILSYDPIYSFYVSGDISLIAVNKATDAQKKPVVVINNVIEEKDAVSFAVQYTVPSGTGYKIEEYGILLSDTFDQNSVFNLSTTEAVRKSAVNSTALTGQFMITKENAGSKTWYGRAYIIYKDGKGNLVTVYSDIVSGKGQ